jgi:site-specific DNA-methyltransferase (adenine-specific)
VSAWTLTLGDCLDPVTGLASLPDKSVDHVICDPPYEAEAHTKQRRTSGKRDGFRVLDVDSLSFDPITEAQRIAVGSHMARLARRWVLVFCQAEAVASWRDALAAGGAIYKRACVWVKTDGMPQMTGDRPGMGYESIVAAHAEGKSRWNAGGKVGVYTFSKQPDGRLTGNDHPTMKPLPLMQALTLDFTDPGETILDPFAGSGTTGVAAIRNGRRFIGWEKDPRYHEIARKRLEGTREQMVLGGPRVKAKQENLL